MCFAGQFNVGWWQFKSSNVLWKLLVITMITTCCLHKSQLNKLTANCCRIILIKWVHMGLFKLNISSKINSIFFFGLLSVHLTQPIAIDLKKRQKERKLCQKTFKQYIIFYLSNDHNHKYIKKRRDNTLPNCHKTSIK